MVPESDLDRDGCLHARHAYSAAPGDEYEGFTPKSPTDINATRAQFDSLMRYFDGLVAVLEKLREIGERTGNEELKRAVSEEIAAAQAGRERVLLLRKLWWNE